MDKINFKKTLKHLYQPSPRIEAVEVPSMQFLMVDGEGDPNTSQAFAEAVAVLFPLAYTLKFMVKRSQLAIDYGVLPLEALWWADDMSVFTTGEREMWKWTVMIMQPEFITGEMVDDARAEVAAKKNPPALARVRFESYAEGQVAQVLHIGPFSEEGPTIERLHRFIADRGLERAGKHHEIYLSDVRRADPARWRTVIRQPMR